MPRDRSQGPSVPGYGGHIPRFHGGSRQRLPGTLSLLSDGQPQVWLERSLRNTGWERLGVQASSHSLVNTRQNFHVV